MSLRVLPKGRTERGEVEAQTTKLMDLCDKLRGPDEENELLSVDDQIQFTNAYVTMRRQAERVETLEQALRTVLAEAKLTELQRVAIAHLLNNGRFGEDKFMVDGGAGDDESA